MTQFENLDPEAPIGVFDSGVGGLTVVREIIRQLPNERLLYFGDTARVPYGTKSKETVLRYTRQIVRFLQSQKVKAIVAACNTVSAVALDEIEKEVEVPIIGVVRPGVTAAAKATRNGRIGVIATKATIESNIYASYLKKIRPDAEVMGKACPLFVPLVENGLLEDPVTDEIAARYLSELVDRDIDTLVLGCTHYPLIRSTIARTVGEQVTLVNPAYETAISLKELLDQYGIESNVKPGLGSNQHRFYVSDDAKGFEVFANSVLKYGILSARVINIENY